MLGVTDNSRLAGLNWTSAPSEPVAWYEISSPCLILAIWLSNVKTLGLDIVFPRPSFSKACISAFKTADPVLFNIPIPLVAPIADEVKSVSCPSPPEIVPRVGVIGPSVAAPPIVPPTISCCLDRLP